MLSIFGGATVVRRNSDVFRIPNLTSGVIGALVSKFQGLFDICRNLSGVGSWGLISGRIGVRRYKF